MPARSSDQRCLVSGFCSSGRDFAPRFLQTVPRGSALALLLVLHLHQVAQGTFTPKLSDMSDTHRDRGTSRDAAPPTPPGIRVRTTAVRRIKHPPVSPLEAVRGDGNGLW